MQRRVYGHLPYPVAAASEPVVVLDTVVESEERVERVDVLVTLERLGDVEVSDEVPHESKSREVDLGVDVPLQILLT